MPDMELKELSEQLKTSFEDFKKVHQEQVKQLKENGVTSAALEEKLAKINADLDKKEKKQREKILALEAKISELPGHVEGGPSERELKHKSTFMKWAKKGDQYLGSEDLDTLKSGATEQKSLIASQDTSGGYLVPEDMERAIIKAIIESTPLRQLARVRPTTSDKSRHPKRTGVFAAQWIQEQGTRTETTGLAWGIEEIPNHELYAFVDVSQRDLEDSAFNLEQELQEEFSEQFAVAEGVAFLKGTGVAQPEGIITAAAATGIITRSTAAANVIAGNDLINAFYDIKDGYARNAAWLIRRATIASIRKLTATSGDYVWQPGLAADKPPTLLGAPYFESKDLDVEGAASRTIAVCGDFRRGYVISDRIGTSVLRDPFTQSNKGLVRFIARRRVGGQVVLGEALVKIVTI